jgi:hypothetical protein
MAAMNVTPPRRNRLARTALVVLIAVVALFGLAWAALAILFPPARVRALVQAQLARSLTREVRFADAGLGLFPPVRLTVKALALSEAGGFANGTAFQTQALQLDLDVLALLSRRVVVKRLALDEPALHLVLRPDGTTNLDGIVRPTPAKTQAPAQAMDFTIDEFALERARLLVDDLKVGARRTLLVDTKIALSTQAQGKRVATSGATLVSDYAFGKVTAPRLADLNTSLSKLALVVEHKGVFDADRKRLALERLDLGLGRARLGLRGVIDDPGPKARLDLRARGERIDFGEVLGALAEADAKAVHGVRGSGRLDFDLAIRGGLGPTATKVVTGTLTVANAAFRYPGAPVGVEALNFTARFAPDSLGIGDLTARVQGQPVKAQLAVMRFKDPLVAFAVQGNLDLAAIGPLVAPKDTKLAGRAGLDLSGRGRAKDPGTMALGGTAVLSQVSVESPQVPKKLEGVNGRITFNADRAQVTGLTARAGSSSLALDASVTRPLALLAKPGTAPPSNVNFDFRAPRLDLAELLPPSSGPPIVLNAVGGGRVAIDRLINQKLDVAQVRADVALEPGIVDAPRFAMKAYGGDVAGSARLDVRDPAKPGVTLKAKVDSLSADQLVSAWTPAKNFLQGSFNTALDFSVQGATPDEMKRSLTAIGLAQMVRGQIGPGPVLAEIARVVKVPALERLRFDDAKLPFHVERGRIVSDPVVLRGGFGEWHIAGAVGFDGALDYAVSATLPPTVTQALSARSALAAGALSDAQGNLLLDLRVTGNAKSPRVAWDPSAMKDRVMGKVSQALQAQQQKLATELQQAALARQQAAVDSARSAAARLQTAVKDSLARRASDALRNFFGGGAKDTSAAKP